MVSKSLYRQFGIVLFGILQVIVPAFALKFYSDTILPAYLRGTEPVVIYLFGASIGLVFGLLTVAFFRQALRLPRRDKRVALAILYALEILFVAIFLSIFHSSHPDILVGCIPAWCASAALQLGLLTAPSQQNG